MIILKLQILNVLIKIIRHILINMILLTMWNPWKQMTITNTKRYIRNMKTVMKFLSTQPKKTKHWLNGGYLNKSLVCTYEQRTDRTLYGITRTPSDNTPRVTYLHSHQLLQIPAEGASRRAYLVGTAIGSDLPSHAISLGWKIVIRFSAKASK